MTTGLHAHRARAGVAVSLLRPLKTSALLAMAAAALTAHAAEPDLLQTVVITATRIPTPRLELASSVTVVTAEQIEARQERTFADVLKDIPGLNVVQTGGPGGVTSVFMRGTNSNHTKVLIDGIDVGDPSNATGAYDFGQLLTQDIERVEVLRGPQSGLYGSDAIGGVISVITKAGSGPLKASALLEGGSFDTFNQAGGVSGSQDAFHYAANVAHFHSGSTPVTPLDLLQPGETRNNDYYDNFTASTKLGLDVTQDFDLGLVARYTNTHLRTTGDTFDPITFASFPAPEQTAATSDQYYGRLTAHLVSFDGILDHTLGFGYTHDRTSTVEPESAENLNTGERKKVDWQGNIKAAAGETVVLGAEYERDGISEPISADVHVTSGYAELQSQIGEHWFSALNVRYDDNSRFGGKVTYRLAPTYVFSDSGTKLKASVGTGFKAPTLSQLFQSFPDFGFFANPNLKPETSTGYDAGIEQGLAHDAVRLGVTYFHNQIRDLITSDPTFTTNINVGRAKTEGVESFLEYRPAAQLTLRLDYTYTEATDEDTNQELLRRPKHKADFDASWRPTDAWLFDVTVLWVGSWADGTRETFAPVQAPGYTIVNLAFSYQLNARLALFGRIDNLLDRDYQNPTGFLQPRIGAFAGIKLRL